MSGTEQEVLPLAAGRAPLRPPCQWWRRADQVCHEGCIRTTGGLSLWGFFLLLDLGSRNSSLGGGEGI